MATDGDLGGGWSPRRLHRLPIAVFLVLLVVTAAVTTFSHTIVANQERRLLAERANEVSLVLADSLTSARASLALLASNVVIDGQAGFDREADTALTSIGGGPAGLALVRPGPAGLVVVAAAGTGLPVGSVLSGPSAVAVRAALAGTQITASGIYRVGGVRAVGLALAVRDGTALYRQSLLGPVRPPQGATTSPFSELRVVLYTSDHPDPAQVLVATTGHLPLRGAVSYAPLRVGDIRWLTGVKASQPLVGSVAASAQWVALAVGVAASVLVLLLVEGMARRRDATEEALRQEHRFAEALQRRLLPDIPAVAGLDIASGYVTGSDLQAVGGDWFDVFALPSGATGVAIGDVMGHDVEAAAVMAQLRSVLRGFASEGSDPATALERMGRFLDTFAIPAVVTVVYGVLDQPDPHGARRLTWANAGHLPPLLRRPDGSVRELDEGGSPLLGAPVVGPRPTATCALEAGDALLLYTDGLVEVPGGDLTRAIEGLRGTLSAADGPGADALCAAVLGADAGRHRRDDVAVLVVRVDDAPASPGPAAATG
ncbi:MAG TPA: PP2C family protein-serine/threonine phosphatase [Acidimicrobiales bacterium]|nr:PP2C family protein-serine/threonine phosphatase [Acidimicrobiales bacterium]